ncbi:LOW QUALITY PROTEIN: AAA-ATPase At3g28610-like [Rutidosis leptorrhynchoides]|uniref:LOW QUALITY PROTEIN: AAA-ATPase At3g28610-like n=1 Tax=Rutidosis leptorrhynchoides TaxID=125765 RepID=UPI003A993332
MPIKASSAERLVGEKDAVGSGRIMHLDHPFDECMLEVEYVDDVLNGIKVWWSFDKKKSFYKITCYRKHRDFANKVYLQHVLKEGEIITRQTKKRKIYANARVDNRVYWTCTMFEHPSTFDTLAMDPKKKRVIMNDLTKFRDSKDYYNKIGKAWKRGYLLYGPPRIGKSSMIMAMANFLDYDIYDLELTSLKNNMELRKLLNTDGTSGKSIIVIEDIDCSLYLTGQRKNKKEKQVENNKKKEDQEKSEVTLSGLLNFTDGLWSACGKDRLIVFTTNHVKKLDPAFIRRGRMDMQIVMSYCGFGAFKFLAKNYLDIEMHELFETVRGLLEEVNITPADVAENLMPKSQEENADVCLNNLMMKCLETKKEKARLKAETKIKEKARLKAENKIKVKARLKAENKRKEKTRLKDINKVKSEGGEISQSDDEEEYSSYEEISDD